MEVRPTWCRAGFARDVSIGKGVALLSGPEEMHALVGFGDREAERIGHRRALC